jgi:hypothetical protein
MIQKLFPNNAVFQDENAPIHTAELFSHGLKSMKVTSTSSLASTVARLENH